VKQAVACELNLVYCIGESEEQRDKEQTEEVLDEQLSALKGVHIDWTKTIIVYEPRWAMGTGTIASADQTQEACEQIREWVAKNFSQADADATRIVYGGSVTESNCENLVKLPDVDGFLVGSSSTKPTFRTIFEIMHR